MELKDIAVIPEMCDLNNYFILFLQMLLGMYRCTDVPGEFVWQPGTLTQAATKGHWILLEDIDYAPLDVVCGFANFLSLKSILLVILRDNLNIHV